ncbi:HisA/HisF-related TIM barrel protein [Planctomycetaceae bacterium SH139]
MKSLPLDSRLLDPQLLGVIDLRDGQAVHAVAGFRDQYLPIDIPGLAVGDALQLAAAYQHLGVGGLYIADLDALTNGSRRSAEMLKQLIATSALPLWIDIGLSDWQSDAVRAGVFAELLGPAADPSAITWILATESMRAWPPAGLLENHTTNGCGQVTDRNQIAVSLDLRGGRVLSQVAAWQDLETAQVAEQILAAGVNQLIVLDLASVGTDCGAGTQRLCQQLAEAHPRVRLIAGGGARGERDVRAWLSAGCTFVLSGTWLHRRLANRCGGNPSLSEEEND